MGQVYPVGSIYISVNSTNPGTSLGVGTWVAFGAGRVPVGFDAGQIEFDTDEQTGGSMTATPAGSNSAPVFTGSANQNTSAVSAGTPAGSNSAPTFAGAPLGNHAHELPVQLVSGTVSRQLASTVFGTGTSRAAQSQQTETANTTSAAVALSQAVSAGTPAGTVSAPTFTGSALGTHQHTLTPAGTVSAPAFTGSALPVVQPYITVRMWKRTA